MRPRSPRAHSSDLTDQPQVHRAAGREMEIELEFPGLATEIVRRINSIDNLVTRRSIQDHRMTVLRARSALQIKTANGVHFKRRAVPETNVRPADCYFHRNHPPIVRRQLNGAAVACNVLHV